MAGNKAEAREANLWLETLNARAHRCRQELYAAGNPFTATHIRRLMQGEEIEPVKMISEAWDYYMNYIAGLIGKDYSFATLQKYRSGYKAFKAYLQFKYQTDDISFKMLNYQFIKDYEYFLKTSYGVQNNTAIQHIRKLRTMVRIAMDFSWLSRDPFLAHRMHANEVHRDYLTSEELNLMAKRSMAPKRLLVVRDLFLFSCYTGLSYADTVKLTVDDLIQAENGDWWVQTYRVKNNNRVRVPLLPPALALLDFYKDHPRTPEGKLLPNISNQRANSYLKEIAKKLGLKKRLTYHCARHTFATTVTLTNGVPIETVGQMLGHKSIRTTQHYARITDTKIRIDMQPLKERYMGQQLYLESEIE
jgi:site-specific recombinase XerD